MVSTTSEKRPAFWRRHAGLLILLLLFLTVGMGYNILNPLHEGTDELRHYRFVRYISVHASLPVQGQEACRSQSHHPPLIYAIGALATGWIDTGRDICYTPPENPFWAYRYWEVGVDNKNQYLHGPDQAFPWSGEALAARLLRAINLLVGAGAVALTYAMGGLVWPARRALALAAAALVAFSPMFLYVSATINNDAIAAFSGAAVSLACLRLLQEPAILNRRYGTLLGGLFGLALLSKFNLAALILLITAAVSWAAWRQKSWRLWLENHALVGTGAFLLAGWWFIRNFRLYGDPTGFTIVTELWGARNPAESVELAIHELPYVWSSLWGRFGFGQIPLPQAIYDGLWIMTLLAAAGLLILFIRRRQERQQLLPYAFLLLNVAVAFAVLFNYMLVSPAGAMGRFFFPGLPALAILLMAGLNELVELGRDLLEKFGNYQASPGFNRRVRREKQRPLRPPRPLRLAITKFISRSLAPLHRPLLWPGSAGLAMFSLALIALFGYLAPAYARPPTIPPDAVIPNPVNVRFDALATLLGYEISDTAVHPGRPVEIALYWEVNHQPPGDYLLFVHLIDEIGTMVAQRDTHPGLGNFPSSQWRAGDRFVETIRLWLPETAYAPSRASLTFGLYAPDGYRLAIQDEAGSLLGDAFPLAEITILPWESLYPNAQNQNFNNEIKLLGYEYDRRAIRPGEIMSVTLYWQALQDHPTDYLVHTRLLDDANRIWGQADGPPQFGPTRRWLAGDVWPDERQIQLNPDAPAGYYTVEIALFDPAAASRPNIIGEGGHWIDDRLPLAPIRVE